jgi:hypothetical protein
MCIDNNIENDFSENDGSEMAGGLLPNENYNDVNEVAMSRFNPELADARRFQRHLKNSYFT